MPETKFENDLTYLPVTMQQFQDLTNEILIEFNKITQPHGLDGNYMAQVVHGVIHSLDRTEAYVSKSMLLDRCINMVSKHVTYHAIKEIEARLKAQKENETNSENPSKDNVVPFDQEPA